MRRMRITTRHLQAAPCDSSWTKTEGGDWTGFSVDRWRDAIPAQGGFHSNLYNDTTEALKAAGEQLGGCGNCTLIEVGSGTGEALFPLNKTFKNIVGIEFNQDFVDYCNKQPETTANMKHIFGDACHARKLLSEHCPEWTSNPKVVCCLGNTIGIMPDEIKEEVFKEMAETAGDDGLAVMVWWNGNKFGDALQHFYHANPSLCGKFTGECIDLDTTTLQTPSGYRTHWTKPDEARAKLEGYGLKVVSVTESKTDRVGVIGVFKRA